MYDVVNPNFHRFDINVMPGPRKNKLRRAIKEMAHTSSRKVWSEEAMFNLVHVLQERAG